MKQDDESISLTPAGSGTEIRASGAAGGGLLEASDRVLLRLSRLLAYAGAAALGVILLVMCAHIAGSSFGGGIRGSAEFCGYLGALALGLSLPLSQITGAHISGGLWNKHLPKALRLLMEAAVSLGCAVVLFFAAEQIFGVALYGLEMGDYIDGFKVSYFPMAAALALGLLLQGVIFAQSLLKLLILRKGAAA